MQLKRRGRTVLIGVILAALAGFARHGENILNRLQTPNTTIIQDSVAEDVYKIKRVVDGDTFVIDYEGRETKVRLIGVDTPESVSSDAASNVEWGEKASTFTKDLLDGKTVYLEFDEEKEDRYGRLLAYAYLKKQDGSYTMFNQTLVKEGFHILKT